MRILDAFCGAGGASVGYHRAFPEAEIVGVDIAPQPRYPFTFMRADAMACLDNRPFVQSFDFIHASPPCQAYSSATKAWGRQHEHADLYVATRERLIASGVPWAIENVIGAPIGHGLLLCGSMFGLDVQRHRTFETSHLIMAALRCHHSGLSLTVTGHSPYWWNRGLRTMATTEEIAIAMGIDWMNRREIVQAIPPAYTEYIGAQFAATLGVAA